MFKSLVKFLQFNFAVNFPLKSKYYHKQLSNNVSEVIKLIKRQNVLNQKCFLLQHLSDLMTKDRKIVLSTEQRKIVSQQIQKWKNQNGRFQHIATVAWVIKKLNLQKIHQQLFSQIKQRFLDDQWYVNFDQSVKALQVFKSLPQGQDKNIIFQKIQRNVGLTMWNVHMKYYQRISTSLLKAGRFKSQLWERMEHQILQNLGMEYQTRTICDIFKAFALSRNGHDVFYQMMQKVLFQGHFNQNYFSNFKSISNQFDDSGEFFSIVIETYSIARKSCGVILTPDFKDFVYHKLMDKKTQFNSLKALTKVIKNLQQFQFQQAQIPQIQQVLLQKRPKNFSTWDLKQFYQLMQNRHGKIPQQIHKYLQSSLIKQIKQKFISACQLVDLTNYLLSTNYLLNQQQVIGQVNSFLQNNYKYLYADEAKYVVQAIKQSKLITNNNTTFLKLPGNKQKNTDKIF